MKRHIEIPKARLEDLERLHAFIDEFTEQTDLDEAIVFALRLAIEEVYVNLIQHGYKGKPGLVTLALETNAHQVIASIGDKAPPFPPDKAPRPKLDQDWASRPIGGLGWHFIREMMDEIRYHSDSVNGNMLTLVKHFGRRDDNSMANKLQITVSEHDRAVVISAAGRIDSVTGEMFALALQNEIERGNVRLVVDLSQVTYISSAGIHAVTVALREARKRHGDVCVAGAQANVRRVFSVSGITTVAEFYPDVDAAIQNFIGKES